MEFLPFLFCGQNLTHCTLVCSGKVRKMLSIGIVPMVVVSVSYFNGVTTYF